MSTTTDDRATLTNLELGQRIGCSHSMASRIRRGERMPGIDTIERISAAFGIPTAKLLKARREGATVLGDLIETAARKAYKAEARAAR